MQRFLLLLLCFVVSYTGDSKDYFHEEHLFPKKSNDNWINSFNEFRNSVSKNDKAKTKQFIDFPIMNANNEIWDLAYDNDYKLVGKLPANPQPFTEADFDKYFNKVFTKRFINTILKINAEELYNKGSFKTQDFKDGTITYKMFATYDKESQTLSLNLASQTQGRSEDNGMFNVIYQFDILNGTQIKFRQVRIAG